MSPVMHQSISFISQAGKNAELLCNRGFVNQVRSKLPYCYISLKKSGLGFSIIFIILLKVYESKKKKKINFLYIKTKLLAYTYVINFFSYSKIFKQAIPIKLDQSNRDNKSKIFSFSQHKDTWRHCERNE